MLFLTLQLTRGESDLSDPITLLSTSTHTFMDTIASAGVFAPHSLFIEG